MRILHFVFQIQIDLKYEEHSFTTCSMFTDARTLLINSLVKISGNRPTNCIRSLEYFAKGALNTLPRVARIPYDVYVLRYPVSEFSDNFVLPVFFPCGYSGLHNCDDCQLGCVSVSVSGCERERECVCESIMKTESELVILQTSVRM